ncbi:hypothetical protein [Fodinibacter luteus]
MTELNVSLGVNLRAVVGVTLIPLPGAWTIQVASPPVGRTVSV